MNCYREKRPGFPCEIGREVIQILLSVTRCGLHKGYEAPSQAVFEGSKLLTNVLYF